MQVFAFSKLFLRTTFPLGCSPTARPDESVSPKQTIESHTLSPQIGKDCFKPGQTHLLHKLKQLAARFFSCFSCFLGIFFILQIQLVTAHFVACPSDAAITPWNYVLFVWLLVQRHLYLQDLMQRLVWSQLCLPTGATPHVRPHLLAMDKGSQQRFGTVSVCRSS